VKLTKIFMLLQEKRTNYNKGDCRVPPMEEQLMGALLQSEEEPSLFDLVMVQIDLRLFMCAVSSSSSENVPF